VRIGSLFSGIGGLELGLEWSGIGHTAWHCEIDPFCRQVLAKRWPGTECAEDVTTFDPARGSADLICGGFPCQDISVAGKGAGIHDGKRSGLWREYRRIVDGVRPRWVVVENVGRGWRRWVPAVRAICGDSGTPACQFTCVPVTSAPGTKDRGSLLLPTLTACSYDYNQGGQQGRLGKKRYSLQSLARRGLLPTLTVCGNYNRKGASPTSGDGLATVLGGTLNPEWAEWFMGFPQGWTDEPAVPAKKRSATP
jgi:DNA (cytosine-5)-methyltransferase 1